VVGAHLLSALLPAVSDCLQLHAGRLARLELPAHPGRRAHLRRGFLRELVVQHVGNRRSAAAGEAEPVLPSRRPINQAKPALTGTAAAGQKLRCDAGSWAGFPTGYSYQ
jgi:hypothetical protein